MPKKEKRVAWAAMKAFHHACVLIQQRRDNDRALEDEEQRETPCMCETTGQACFPITQTTESFKPLN